MVKTNEYPLISIVTVVYNGKESLKKTVESVINQTYENKEYVIIDGGSTDGTINIIRNYENQITSWISEPDKGVYDAMNKGLNLASGQWLVFLNAEDTFFSDDTISEIFDNENNYKLKLIYGDWINVNKKGLNKYIKSWSYLNNDHLKSRFQMNHQALFVKNQNLPKFDLTYKIKADYQWVIDIVKSLDEKEILYLPKPFVKYDLDGLSATALLLNLKEYMYLTKRNFGLFQVIKNSDIYIKYLIKYILFKTKKLMK